MQKNMLLSIAKTVQEALSMDDPLTALDCLVNEETPAGSSFHWVYVAMVETNSSGLSILLDRFGNEVLDTIEGALHEVGATKTLGDLHTLREIYNGVLLLRSDRDEASEMLDTHPEARSLVDQVNTHVGEMEQTLLTYATARMDEFEIVLSTEEPINEAQCEEIASSLREIIRAAQKQTGKQP